MTTLKMTLAMSAVIVTLAPAAQAYATFEEQPSPVLERLQMAFAEPLIVPTSHPAEICEMVVTGAQSETPVVELACAAE